MIPKIVHYGLFGGWQLSPLNRSCIQTWREVLPDYEIRLWTDKDMRDRFARPINNSNLLKYHALFNHGGVFLDNDMEVLKPFDLSRRAFLAFQRTDMLKESINTAVIGAEKGHPFIGECLREIQSHPEEPCPIWLGCGLPTDLLIKSGMRGLNVDQDVGDVHVYDRSAFYPWSWEEEPDAGRITDSTFAIHHWEGSWKHK